MRIVPFCITLAGAVLAACGADVNALRTRAAFDFKCPQDQINLTYLSGGAGNMGGVGAVYGAEGCGQRATYVQPEQGTWLMNTADGKPAESAGK
jgi:hypothetical protein